MAIVRLQRKFGKLNHSRDTLPSELEKQDVPLSLWTETVDGFEGWHNWSQQNGGRTHHSVGQGNSSDSAGVIMTLGIVFFVFGFMIPFCFVVGLVCMISACCIGVSSSSGRGAWHTFDTFLHNQKENYERYNIKLRREGLDRFPELVLETEESSSYQPPQTLAQDLQTLANLHQSGALTTEEFTRAKERVIQGKTLQKKSVSVAESQPPQPPPAPVAEPVSGVPTVPEAEVASVPEIV